MRVKDEGVELAINMNEFASVYFADKSVAADGSVTWAYKDGIEGPVVFHIALVKKGDAERGGNAVQLTYTNVREDYPNLSDAAFANFRMIATTGMGEGALYRTASPIDPSRKRNTCADLAIRMAGVKTVMNLSNNRETAEGFAGYPDSYYATTDFIALGMDMSFETEDSRRKLAEGLRFFATHEGPYAVHCLEGKDRTGTVAALLECLMGASYEEVRKSYMETFYSPRNERHFAINPLNWKTDATPADRAQNKGAVFVTNSLEATEAPQLCGAYLGYGPGRLEGDGRRSGRIHPSSVHAARGRVSRL